MPWVPIPPIWRASTAEMMSGCIQIFAKAPIAGLAKSRLIPALGAEGAANLQAQFIHYTLTTTLQLQLPVELWCAPDIDHPVFTSAARDYTIALNQQQGADLGSRMHHALECSVARGGPVVLIGTDCPALTAADLQEAFDALNNGHDAVLGPAADGGYYLIGLKQALPQLFSDMPWSTPEVLHETRRRLLNARWRWHELRMLHDIDTPADLRHLPSELTQVIAHELA